MADVNGLVNDQDFQKLDPASQRQALSRVTGDQSFGQLSDDDTRQFVSRISGVITPESMMAKSQQQAQVEGQKPLTKAVQQRGVQDQQAQALDQSLSKPSGLENTVSQVKRGNYPGAIHAAASGLASAYSPLLAPALMTAPVATLAGLAGSAAGQFLGKNTASAFGASPDWQDVAGDVGAVAGGVGGGLAGTHVLPENANDAAALLRNPATARQSQMINPNTGLGKPGTVKNVLPSSMQRWMVPDWMVPKGEHGTPTNPGMFMDLPVKLNRDQAADFAASQSLSPYSPRSQTPGVSVVPEPRPEFEGENPNYMASVKRNKLMPLSRTGKPGAARQLQQLGDKLLYVPPSGFNEPRSVTNFDEDPYSPTR